MAQGQLTSSSFSSVPELGYLLSHSPSPPIRTINESAAQWARERCPGEGGGEGDWCQNPVVTGVPGSFLGGGDAQCPGRQGPGDHKLKNAL